MERENHLQGFFLLSAPNTESQPEKSDLLIALSTNISAGVSVNEIHFWTVISVWFSAHESKGGCVSLNNGTV